jgi:hypothetical protein
VSLSRLSFPEFLEGTRIAFLPAVVGAEPCSMVPDEGRVAFFAVMKPGGVIVQRERIAAVGIETLLIVNRDLHVANKQATVIVNDTDDGRLVHAASPPQPSMSVTGFG